ncbi:hypothetical protein GPN2_14102 [Streptomyces murinus]
MRASRSSASALIRDRTRSLTVSAGGCPPRSSVSTTSSGNAVLTASLLASRNSDRARPSCWISASRRRRVSGSGVDSTDVLPELAGLLQCSWHPMRNRREFNDRLLAKERSLTKAARARRATLPASSNSIPFPAEGVVSVPHHRAHERHGGTDRDPRGRRDHRGR